MCALEFPSVPSLRFTSHTIKNRKVYVYILLVLYAHAHTSELVSHPSSLQALLLHGGRGVACESIQEARLRRKLDERGLLRPLAPTAQRTLLKGGAWYDMHDAWMQTDEADALLQRVLDQEPLVQLSFKAYNPETETKKDVPQNRLMSWLGTETYVYSGLTLEPRSPPFGQESAAALWSVMERASAYAGLKDDKAFNHVVVNYYRDGHDDIGWHADDEAQLGRNPLVAALSLGVTRQFHIRKKRTPTQRRPRILNLVHGSLLVMGGNFQHTHLHAVPREVGTTGRRVNITFRRLQGPPGWSDAALRSSIKPSL